MNLGQLYESSFRVLRRAPAGIIGGYVVTTLLGTLVVIALMIAGAALMAGIFAAFVEDIDFSSADPGVTTLIALIAVILLFVVLGSLPQYLPMAGVTWATSEVALGRKPKIFEVVKKSMASLPAILLWALIAAIVLPLVFGIVTALFLFVGSALPESLRWLVGLIGVMTGLLMLLAVVVFTWFLVPSWSVENRSALGAIQRSIKLGLRNPMPVLGIALLTSIMVNVVSGILLAPLQLIAVVGQASAEQFDEQINLAGSLASNIPLLAASWVITALVYPFICAVMTLHLLDQRMRFEGLDVKLAAALEKEVPDIVKAREVLTEKS